ncbi:MAG: hypothetical protein J0H69_19740 [Burkholderiales bacterium]|nr:hypothetical protein [Burkholderiales bacterium]
MADLYRVALLLLALWFTPAAHALIPFQTGEAPTSSAVGVFTQAQVNGCVSTYSTGTGGPCVYRVYALPMSGGTPGNCAANTYCHILQRSTCTIGYCYLYDSIGRGTALCPVNSTAVSGGCQCNSGWQQNPSATACVQEPSQKEQLCAQLKEDASPWPFAAGGYQVNTACDEEGLAGSYGGGCVVEIGGIKMSFKDEATGVWTTHGTARYTGAVCQGSSTTPVNGGATPPLSPASAPVGASNPCPNGQPGQVNGVTVCLPMPSGITTAGTEGSSKTVTNPDGTKVKTDVERTTQCSAGQCTTSTTTTVTNINSSGTVTGTSSTTSQGTAPKGQFCAENPGNAQCDGPADSSFGGSCGAGFTCTGDAVQCAVAQEIHRQNCKWNDTSSAEYARYQADKTRTGDQTADLPGSSTVSLAPGAFDTTDALGGGGGVGVADLNVQVWGRDLTLPFSNLNPYLVIMGNVLLACTFVLCARIVMRG